MWRRGRRKEATPTERQWGRIKPILMYSQDAHEDTSRNKLAHGPAEVNMDFQEVSWCKGVEFGGIRRLRLY